MASAGFDPRFRRASDGTVEVTLRDCPFRELLDDHRDLVCSIHQGLVEGMLGALEPPLSLDGVHAAHRARDLPGGGAGTATLGPRAQGTADTDR